ncbi:tryptophan-rich sensory protein [Methylobacterium sp. ID0610]|uniref:tryptophan-rich sensory protein n=1 Tax=Methylobacterium carpenticola TaxID=3344827 RepID=UPI003689AD5B
MRSARRCRARVRSRGRTGPQPLVATARPAVVTASSTGHAAKGAPSEGVLLRDGRIAAFALCRPFGRGRVIGPLVAASDADAIAVARPHVAARAGRFLRLDTRRKSGPFADVLMRSGAGPRHGDHAVARPARASPSRRAGGDAGHLRAGEPGPELRRGQRVNTRAAAGVGAGGPARPADPGANPMPHRRSSNGALSPGAALLAVGGALALSGLISRRYRPDRSHPDIARWYRRLDTPAWKPPDAVFAGAWPVLLPLMSAGAYRLMRQPRSPARDEAIVLWALTVALVTGYTKVLFGERSLTGSVAEGALVVAAGAGFVARSARVDGIAAASGVPLTLWSAFGDALSEDLRRRNPDLDGRDPPGSPAS